MTIGTEHDLIALKEIGRIVALTLKYMTERTEAGMTTAELDAIGAELLAWHGAVSAPISEYGFPGHTCISINEEAAHGIPGPRVIQPGDVVNIDVSAKKDGYFADTGGSFVVPPATALKNRLIRSTRLALQRACEQVSADRPINGIGRAVQQVAGSRGFRVIRNLCGHGVGRSLHEEPTSIAGFYDPNDRRVLREGMVIAVEPFLSTRSRSVSERDDGWTLAAEKGNLSAQFEHTMVVTRGKPILLTVA